MGQHHRAASCSSTRRSWDFLRSPESLFKLLEGWGRRKSRGAVVCSVVFVVCFGFVSLLKEGLEVLILTTVWGLDGMWFIFTRCRLQRPSVFSAVFLHCHLVIGSRRVEESWLQQLHLHREGAIQSSEELLSRTCVPSDWFSHLAVSGPWFLFLLCRKGWEHHSFIVHPAELLFNSRKSCGGHKNLSVTVAF